MKKEERVTIGYDKNGNTCYLNEKGEILGYAEDNCTESLKKNFKDEAIKELVEKEGMTKEDAEKLYSEAYGEPIVFEEEKQQSKTFSTFKKQ